MKKLLLLIGLLLSISFFMPTKVQAQCPNLNFTMNNFSYWQAYMGTCGSGVNISKSQATPGRHTIMNATQLMLTNQLYDEECVSIPKVPTGFNYSARLGNSAVGAEMEALEYTMTIDSTNSLLILHFAWVMEDPSHSPSEQPMFSMTIKDSLDRTLNQNVYKCSYVNFVASQTLEDLACKTPTKLARNWTTVGFSLEPMMGQKIKIYFETRDCTQSGHYGYAYIVGECRPMTIDLMYCDGQTAARLRAPDGFVWYKWTRSTQSSWVKEGTGRNFQNIVVDDPKPDEEFKCQVTSQLGADCSATLRTVIVKTMIDADFNYGVMVNGNVDIYGHLFNNWYDTCNRTATFVDMSTVTGSKKESIMWEVLKGRGIVTTAFDSLFTYTFPDPETDQPVDYLVRLTVFAENGCADTSKGRVDQHIIIYPSPRISIDGVDQMCAGDSTYLKAVPVRSKFTHHDWSWVDTNGITQTATGDSIQIYGPGTYMLSSLDSNGCYAKDTLVVTTLKPQMTLDITNVNCYGQATGAFQHGPVTGGQTPYQSFKWTLLNPDGSQYVDPNGSIVGWRYQNLIAGIYTFEAIDARGCALYGEVEVKQNDSLRVTGKYTPTTCGADNGTLKLKAAGGVPPYKFEIRKDDGTLVASSDTASNLSSGVYKMTVTDHVNCVTTDTITVSATPIPYMTVSSNVWETCENENGSISVSPKDARYPVSFTWDTGREQDTTNVIGGLKSGTYTVEMTDANGCVVDTSIFVDKYPTPTVVITKTPETCGRGDGTITLTVNSMYPSTLKYRWDGLTDTTSSLTGLKAGTYKVTITDSLCIVSKTIVVEHVDGPVANFESNAYNVASNTIFTLTDVSQGTVNTWNWDMGDGNSQTGKIVYYTYEKSGDYNVSLVVIDVNGCIDSISKIIHVYDELNVFVPNMFTPNGDGLNDTWKPVMSEYSKEGYQLSVFDRWGQRIFHTTNTEDEWNGMVNGKYVASNSIYSYRVIVRDFTGQEYEFVGQVTVIR